MNEKYVKLSDVKKKLNHIYRTYGVSPQMKKTISDALARIPYTVKGELETTLEAEPVKHGEWTPVNIYCNHAMEFKCSACGESVYYDHYTRYSPNGCLLSRSR